MIKIYKKSFLAVNMVLLLSISRICCDDEIFELQPDTTYTIGSGRTADIRFDNSVVSDEHAEVRCDRATGKFSIKCLKKFTPPDTSGIYIANKEGEMAPLMETVLHHGTTLSIVVPWSCFDLEAIDPKSLVKERNELKSKVAKLEWQLQNAQNELKSASEELKAEERLRLRLEEELRAEREKGEGSCPDKRRKV
jgi:hypothetical protein